MRPSVCEIVKNQDIIAEVCHPFVDRRKLKEVRPVVSEVGALSLTSRLEETMSSSCYGLCYHNSNKKNFKSSLHSRQPEVNYGRYDVVSMLRV